MKVNADRYDLGTHKLNHTNNTVYNHNHKLLLSLLIRFYHFSLIPFTNSKFDLGTPVLLFDIRGIFRREIGYTKGTNLARDDFDQMVISTKCANPSCYMKLVLTISFTNQL